MADFIYCGTEPPVGAAETQQLLLGPFNAIWCLLSQLVDRFCTEYGRGSPLAVWALGALSTSVAHRTGHASSGMV